MDLIVAQSISPYLETPLPEGGCAYSPPTEHPSASDASNLFRKVWVQYFNLDIPEKPTYEALEAWAHSAGGWPANDGTDGYVLPDSFSGWSNPSFSAIDAELNFDTEQFPEYFQGGHAWIAFSLDAEDVAALTAASSDNGDSVASDPSTAMAAGLRAPLEVQFQFTDQDGYTSDIVVAGGVDPFEMETEDSLPGEFEAVTQAIFRGTATNTTPGRNVPQFGFSVVAIYDYGANCGWAGVAHTDQPDDDRRFCSVTLGWLSAQEGIPAEGTAEFAIGAEEVRLGNMIEGGDALATLNKPLGIYVRTGAYLQARETEGQADKGCSAAGEMGWRWYVPMDGWPDPVCS